MAHATTPSAVNAGWRPPGVIDIEASGFGKGGYPIEIGFVLPDGQSYCSLIQPAPTWTHWDPEAERLHRIPRSIVVKHGRGVVEIATELNQRLGGLTLYCDGWAHDYAWLNMLYDAADLTPSFKLDNLRALLSDTEAAYWGILKQQVASEMRLQRHRASADAKLLQRTLMRLRGPLPEPPELPASPSGSGTGLA
jgi:hypothetical protein